MTLNNNIYKPTYPQHTKHKNSIDHILAATALNGAGARMQTN